MRQRSEQYIDRHCPQLDRTGILRQVTRQILVTFVLLYIIVTFGVSIPRKVTSRNPERWFRAFVTSDTGSAPVSCPSPLPRRPLPALLPSCTGRRSQSCRTTSPTTIKQQRTIDKRRLKDRICHLDQDIMKVVNVGLMVSLELNT